MSDILVKNMEMPKACYTDEFVYCPFNFFDYDTKSHCGLSDDIRCTKTRRPKDCPLVAVLPHGRLIDADELLASDAIDWGEEAWNGIKHAPTVLEENYE